MDEPEDKKKGFAGFDSMVSNIDKDIAEIRKSAPSRTPSPSAHKAPAPASVAAPRTEPSPPPQQRPVYSPPVKKAGGAGKVWGWVIGIVVSIAVFNAFNKSPQPATAYAPPSSYVPPASSSSNYVTPASSSVEQMPSVGTERSLSNNEIRYCLSEDIRIESMRSAVNNYSSYEIDQFNSVVNDYNVRCSNFRYRKGTLESVRSAVEANRPSLSAEGRGKVLAWRRQSTPVQAMPSYVPAPTPTPIYIPPTPQAPTYVPPSYTPPFPEVTIDQAEINRMQEEGRRYMQGYEAAQRVCGQIPSNMGLMDSWMACMSRQGY